MKLNKLSGLYQASNVTFNPKTNDATSYSWWLFVKQINGLVVFNNYNFSSTTIKHQYKVRRLLDDLGINIDLEIKAPDGLQDLESAIKCHEDIIEKLNSEISKKGSKRSTNEVRQSEILDNMKIIESIKALISSEKSEAVC